MTTILEEAQSLVHGDRGETYGHPMSDFTRTAAMWSAILGTKVEPEQVGLCMIAVKISRQCNKHKRDNLVDLAGYAETIQMVMEKKESEKNVESMSPDEFLNHLRFLRNSGLI